MLVIVSDTSPIRYLVLIEHQDLLRRLYGRILLPDTVARELQAKGTPREVFAWRQAPPEWVEIVPVGNSASPGIDLEPSLGAGERGVLALAMDRKADLILMDERAGVHAAQRLGLTVTGTLGVLAKSAERGWISLKPALDRLQKTNFRAHPKLIHEIIRANAQDQGI